MFKFSFRKLISVFREQPTPRRPKTFLEVVILEDRITPSAGALDLSFGGGVGKLITPFNSLGAVAYSVVVDGNAGKRT